MMYAKDLGIVVRKIDYGESDEIVHLLCVSEGKLHGIAKGSRASKKRFVNNLELYNEIDFEYGRKKGRDGGLALIESASLVASEFSNVDRSYRTSAVAAYLAEIITTGAREGEADRRLYNVLKRIMAALKTEEPTLTFVAVWLFRVLEAMGFQPNLSCCCRCSGRC
jgi:DNA repair protein RecO (recombination protein O)